MKKKVLQPLPDRGNYLQPTSNTIENNHSRINVGSIYLRDRYIFYQIHTVYYSKLFCFFDRVVYSIFYMRIKDTGGLLE